MSWGTRVVTEEIVAYFVRCSTCGLNEEWLTEQDAERERLAHWREHDDRYAVSDGMDLGYDLNPDPETRPGDQSDQLQSSAVWSGDWASNTLAEGSL